MPVGGRKTVSTGKAARDIRSGLSNDALMVKYDLSEKELTILFRKLVDAGMIHGTEFRHTKPPADTENRKSGALAVSEAQATTLPRSGDRSLGSAGLAVRPGEPPTNQFPHGDGGSIVQDDPFIPEPRHMDTTEWLMLGSGILGALLCFPFFWTRWIPETFKTLVHEMGHTLFGWLFAYPSLPAFDVIWGGGLTLHTERRTILLVLIYAGIAVLMYAYRKNRAALVFLTAVTAVHVFLAITRFHNVLIIAMGHGTELIIAGLFLYRALSGRSVVHAAERPLYAVLGFFVVFADVRMALSLLTSRSAVNEYLSAKDGMFDMDFLRIARDFLHGDMSGVIVVFLLLSIATPVMAFLAFRYEEYLQLAIVKLLVRDPRSA